jgi:hypothetical protein
MEHSAVYNTQAWRELPRSHCAVDLLLGGAAGPCAGKIHHHHVDPDDPYSRTLQVCASHHPKLHAALRSLSRRPKRCTHQHRYDWARRECERRLNS